MQNVLLNFLYTAQNLDGTTFFVSQYDFGNGAAENLYGTENMTTDSENLYDSSSAAVIRAIGATSHDISKSLPNSSATVLPAIEASSENIRECQIMLQQ